MLGNGNLDAVVVEKVEDGEKLIEWYKKKGLGQVRAIVFAKQQHLNAQREDVVNTPEGAKRVVDLVRVTKQEHWCIFYNLLQNTLVADNIDEAVRISYLNKEGNYGRRWNVVTLDGNKVESSGAMTGGGSGAKTSGRKPFTGSGAASATCEYTREEHEAGVAAWTQLNKDIL